MGAGSVWGGRAACSRRKVVRAEGQVREGWVVVRVVWSLVRVEPEGPQ